MSLTIQKYIPDRLYGFVQDGAGKKVFFHLRVFRPGTTWIRSARCAGCDPESCAWADNAPPPILGEPVEVVLGSEIETTDSDIVPRAEKVTRLSAPTAVSGRVDTFDAQRGYGFILGDDGVSYHLHRSEVTEGKMPLPGQGVLFYPGTRQEKPRACHVKICDRQKKGDARG